MIAYILFSEFLFYLDTWAGSIALIVSLTGCMTVYGVLLCILVASQNRRTEGKKNGINTQNTRWQIDAEDQIRLDSERKIKP
jgi:hypothetical protein